MNANLLRCKVVSLPDSIPDLRRHDELSNNRKSFTYQNKISNLKTRVLRMQFAVTLYFTGQILMNFLLNVSFKSIFLNYDLMRSVNC
jgi:hypothetical protein